MLTNSELPMCMMDQNLDLNDYDFVLFHLYESNSEYRKYYLDMRVLQPDRLMILDNSAYEYFVKGKRLDIAKYIDAIQELQPDIYILPDILQDGPGTIERVKEFRSFVKNLKIELPGKPMGVIQGSDEYEIIQCLNEYKRIHISHIAIPFHIPRYKSLARSGAMDLWKIRFNDSITEDMMYALGRIELVQRLRTALYDMKHIHLLGSHHPWEKAFYPPFIKTMDTGYPVKCGIAGYRYMEEPEKPNIIIDEFLNEDLCNHTKKLIVENVIRFRYQ